MENIFSKMGFGLVQKKSSFSPVLKLPLRMNVRELNALLEKNGVFEKLAENLNVSLTSTQVEDSRWDEGQTTEVLKENQEFYFSEGDFKCIHSALQKTYFEDVYNRVNEVAPGRLGRVRIFQRNPRTSSSLHSDLDVRFHLALKSSPSSFLVFPDHGVYRVPADGFLYMVDTTVPHFAVNTDNSDERVHLVFNTFCGFREKRELQDKIVQAGRDLFIEISKRQGVVAC